MKDELYFYDELEKTKDLSFSINEIRSSINFIFNNLEDDEWLIIHPGSLLLGTGVSITHDVLLTRIQITMPKHGRPLYNLCDFIKEIVPLGLDLIQLRHIQNFGRLIEKLNIPSHERTSTMLVIFVAAKLLRSGYSVDLEPPNKKGGFCDLKVCKPGQNDIYIECKALNSHESELKQKRQNFIQALSDHILRKTISLLPPDRSIIVELPDNYMRRPKTDLWIDSIISSLKDKEFDQWKQVTGIKYRIHFGSYSGTLPARYLVVGSGITPGFYNVLITSAMGNASSTLRKTIKEAKHQIPDNQYGVIIIQTQDFDILTNIATERLSRQDFSNIICIIGINSSHDIKTMRKEFHTAAENSFDLVS